jgi:hypothetical protein
VKYTYEQGELRGIVGEERRGKEIDGCPLTTPPVGCWFLLVLPRPFCRRRQSGSHYKCQSLK